MQRTQEISNQLRSAETKTKSDEIAEAKEDIKVIKEGHDTLKEGQAFQANIMTGILAVLFVGFITMLIGVLSIFLTFLSSPSTTPSEGTISKGLTINAVAILFIGVILGFFLIWITRRIRSLSKWLIPRSQNGRVVGFKKKNHENNPS